MLSSTIFNSWRTLFKLNLAIFQLKFIVFNYKVAQLYNKVGDSLGFNKIPNSSTIATKVGKTLLFYGYSSSYLVIYSIFSNIYYFMAQTGSVNHIVGQTCDTTIILKMNRQELYMSNLGKNRLFISCF